MVKVSLKTIATEVGVTASTVSRIMRNDATCYISPLKKEAILNAIKKYNYTPNINARNLVMGKNFNVAFVTRDFGDFHRFGPFPLASAAGIQEELQKKGYSCTLATISSESDIRKLVNNTGLYDGIIFGNGVVREKEEKALKDALAPVVFLNDNAPFLSTYPMATVNKQKGVEELCSHLKKMGHRRVALYGYGGQMETIFRVFNSNGMKITEKDIFKIVSSNVYNLTIDAYLQADDLLGHLRNYTVICCANDFIALSLCKRLNERKIIPGRDISVTGFDNVEKMLEEDEDKRFLTTIDNLRKTVGSECAKILLRLINGKKTASNLFHKKIESQLIIRKSATYVNSKK